MVLDLAEGKGFPVWDINLYLHTLQQIKSAVFELHSDNCDMLCSPDDAPRMHTPMEQRLPTKGEHNVLTLVFSNYTDGESAEISYRPSKSGGPLIGKFRTGHRDAHLACAGTQLVCHAIQELGKLHGDLWRTAITARFTILPFEKEYHQKVASTLCVPIGKIPKAHEKYTETKCISRLTDFLVDNNTNDDENDDLGHGKPPGKKSKPKIDLGSDEHRDTIPRAPLAAYEATGIESERRGPVFQTEDTLQGNLMGAHMATKLLFDQKRPYLVRRVAASGNVVPAWFDRPNEKNEGKRLLLVPGDRVKLDLVGPTCGVHHTTRSRRIFSNDEDALPGLIASHRYKNEGDSFDCQIPVVKLFHTDPDTNEAISIETNGILGMYGQGGAPFRQGTYAPTGKKDHKDDPMVELPKSQRLLEDINLQLFELLENKTPVALFVNEETFGTAQKYAYDDAMEDGLPEDVDEDGTRQVGAGLDRVDADNSPTEKVSRSKKRKRKRKKEKPKPRKKSKPKSVPELLFLGYYIMKDIMWKSGDSLEDLRKEYPDAPEAVQQWLRCRETVHAKYILHPALTTENYRQIFEWQKDGNPPYQYIDLNENDPTMRQKLQQRIALDNQKGALGYEEDKAITRNTMRDHFLEQGLHRTYIADADGNDADEDEPELLLASEKKLAQATVEDMVMATMHCNAAGYFRILGASIHYFHHDEDFENPMSLPLLHRGLGLNLRLTPKPMGNRAFDLVVQFLIGSAKHLGLYGNDGEPHMVRYDNDDPEHKQHVVTIIFWAIVLRCTGRVKAFTILRKYYLRIRREIRNRGDNANTESIYQEAVNAALEELSTDENDSNDLAQNETDDGIHSDLGDDDSNSLEWLPMCNEEALEVLLAFMKATTGDETISLNSAKWISHQHDGQIMEWIKNYFNFSIFLRALIPRLSGVIQSIHDRVHCVGNLPVLEDPFNFALDSLATLLSECSSTPKGECLWLTQVALYDVYEIYDDSLFGPVTSKSVKYGAGSKMGLDLLVNSGAADAEAPEQVLNEYLEHLSRLPDAHLSILGMQRQYPTGYGRHEFDFTPGSDQVHCEICQGDLDEDWSHTTLSSSDDSQNSNSNDSEASDRDFDSDSSLSSSGSSEDMSQSDLIVDAATDDSERGSDFSFEEQQEDDISMSMSSESSISEQDLVSSVHGDEIRISMLGVINARLPILNRANKRPIGPQDGEQACCKLANLYKYCLGHYGYSLRPVTDKHYTWPDCMGDYSPLLKEDLNATAKRAVEAFEWCKEVGRCPCCRLYIPELQLMSGEQQP